MRRVVLATAATLAILAAGSYAPNRAEAMTVTTPAGLQAAVDRTTLLEDVAVACRRAWRCGPYGSDGVAYAGAPHLTTVATASTAAAPTTATAIARIGVTGGKLGDARQGSV